LVVFMDDNSWCWLGDVPHFGEILGEAHKWNGVAKGGGESNAFGFTAGQGDGCLELASPHDGTVVAGDDAATARQTGGTRWVIGTKVASEIGVDKAFEALVWIRTVVETFVSVVEEVSKNAFDCCLVDEFGIGAESSALVHCAGNVWTCGAGEVSQHAELGPVAPFLFARCAVCVCMESDVRVGRSVMAGDRAIWRKVEAVEHALNEERL